MDAIYKKKFVLYTRSYAYPFFSMISILVFKNINSILFIQHLLSISSLLVAFWLLEKNLRSLKNVKIFWLQFLFATAFLIVCFWNGSIILFEKTLRPEGLTLFSFSLLAFLFYGYIQKRNQGNLRASSRLFFILFFCLLFMSFLHSRMTLGFYSVGIYLFICHFKQTDQKIRLILKSLILIGIMILPQQLFSNKEESMQSFAHRQFFFSHFNEIDEILKEGEFINEGFDKESLPKIINNTFTQSNTQWTYILNYNIDYPQYVLFSEVLEEENFIPSIINSKKNEISLQNRAPNLNDTLDVVYKIKNFKALYFNDWFNHILFKHPIKSLKKCFRQLSFFLFDHRVTFINQPNIDDFKQGYFDNNEYFKELSRSHHYSLDAKMEFRYPILFIYLFFLANVALKIMVVLSFPIYAFLFVKGKLHPLDTAIIVLFTATIFLIAWFHTFEISRYRESLLPYTLSFAFLGFYRILLLLFKKQDRRLEN